MNAIFKRRSIRNFKEKPVSEKLLAKIIEAGKNAPSAKNRQPWKFIVFAGKAKSQMLDAMEKGILREEKAPLLPDSKNGIPDAKNTLGIMRQAPVVILVMNTNGSSPFQTLTPDDRVTEICDTLSIGAAVENIIIRSQELGLGSLWIANTIFAYKELTEFLGTEDQLVCAIALGYAAEKPAPRPRKSDSEIVEYRIS